VIVFLVAGLAMAGVFGFVIGRQHPSTAAVVRAVRDSQETLAWAEAVSRRTDPTPPLRLVVDNAPDGAA
jgi:hypothetical protein